MIGGELAPECFNIVDDRPQRKEKILLVFGVTK